MKPIKVWAIGVGWDAFNYGRSSALTRLGDDNEPPELFRSRDAVRESIRTWSDAKKYNAKPVRVTIMVDK